MRQHTPPPKLTMYQPWRLLAHHRSGLKVMHEGVGAYVINPVGGINTPHKI